MSSLPATSYRQSTDGFDEPLSDPTGDLLDMDEHAEALAKYIQQHEHQLPFTVGIFGEWGEGKTTLVHFLRHHLSRAERYSPDNPIKFVSFSAWAYTTSEKLWRAMILKIAQVLYQQRKPQEGDAKQQAAEKLATVPEPEPEGWLQAIGKCLTGDAFVWRDSQPLRDEYEEKIRELESTDYGRIARRTPSTQLNQQATIAAVANSALAVMSTVSPLVAGIRNLFGLEPKINATKLMQGEADEASTKSIDALTRFQDIFRDMLKKKAEGETVYVFIDDLDRAQPDVALDIMESIRIALAEVKCVFILAVDERLISQGLRLRYKELFADERVGGLDTKGQDYLEKIIQFRMKVPPRTAYQTQRLIAAEFPHWMPAGDIIQSIAGNNPRRIKQYCQRLTFQNMIGLSPFTLASAPAAEVARADQAVEGGPAVPEESKGSEIVELSRILKSDFTREENRELSLALGENFAQFSGESDFEKLDALLVYFKKNDRVGELKEAMKQMKPGVFDEPGPDKP